jgi:hypothetical protein
MPEACAGLASGEQRDMTLLPLIEINKLSLQYFSHRVAASSPCLYSTANACTSVVQPQYSHGMPYLLHHVSQLGIIDHHRLLS